MVGWIFRGSGRVSSILGRATFEQAHLAGNLKKHTTGKDEVNIGKSGLLQKGQGQLPNKNMPSRESQPRTKVGKDLNALIGKGWGRAGVGSALSS